ncbi:MAG: hypothetical protein LBJ46_11245 [Planctomycetota bacterium]|jgi:hypothetical protein|nr:hypothetical protein [Planctomycetota bacterium]
MRNAKDIIKKYQARGYSMESLRVLADSRDEPLRSEMLGLLKAAAEGEDWTEKSSAAAGDDAVFFVVSEDDSVETVDFDIMAEIPGDEAETPAAGGESVAEITIGETEGASLLRVKGGGPHADAPDRSIWSKIWSSLDGALAPGDAPVDSPATGEDQSEDASCVEAYPLGEESAAALASPGTSSGAGNAAGHPQEAAAPGAEVEPASDVSAVDDESAVLTEQSADYMPGSVSEAYDHTSRPSLEQAIRNLEETHSVILAGQSATVPGLPGKLRFEPDQAKDASKPGRKERRRRERAEKKRRKNAKRSTSPAASVGIDLPEIVMSAKEGTETLSVELPHAGKAEPAALSEGTTDFGEVVARSEEVVPIASGTKTPEAKDDVEPVEEKEEESARDVVDESPAMVTDHGEAGAQDASMPEPSTTHDGGEAGDFAMIVACGDIASFSGEERFEVDSAALPESSAETSEVTDEIEEADQAVDESQAETPAAEEADANVILFRAPDALDEEWAYDSGEREFGLRLLSMDDIKGKIEERAGERADVAESEDDAALAPPLVGLSLLKALTPAVPECDACGDCEEYEEARHIIMTPESPDVGFASEAVMEALAEADREHQSRLDEFAKRMLELRTAVAEGEARVTERDAEIEAREAMARESERKLQNAGEKTRALNLELKSVRGEKARADAELARLNGLYGEHERLYKEYEDLRKAYNELVEDVLPPLQNERDELVLAVERQAEDEEELRRKAKRAGRKVAVGYCLAAAASVMMVFLPMVHWMKAGDLERAAAVNLQELSEWRERAKSLDDENQVVKSRMADMEVAMQAANIKLEKLGRSPVVAVRPSASSPGNSDPIRVEDAASLSGPVRPDGRLHRNGVRDPGGAINHVFAQNRERYVQEDAQMALRPSRQQSVQTSAAVRTAPPPAPIQAGAPAGALASQNRGRGQTAMVKKGEGVAQVVYRVLGSRDPEVIDWVIRENKLKKDRRGNPMIYPDQKLQLPASGRTVQAASAARR